MVQQTVDSKYIEHGLGNSETDLPTRDKQPPVSIKKPVLRDLQNNNIIPVPNSIKNSSLLKDRGPISNAVKISGSKRSSPECPEIPSQEQSPNSNAANGHLVYVRRKSEVELGKSSTCDSTSINAYYPNSTQFVHQEETNQSISQNEPKVSCFPAFAPFPLSSSMVSSGIPSVSLPLGKSGMRLGSAEPFTYSNPSLANSKGICNMNWEERYHQLQLILRQLDQSDQEDYLQLLRSLSSVELSRHAVELEKRSIQLSLEEAKELQRVGILNILGKSVKSVKVPSSHQDGTEK
ncbi:hypothetical protein FNV43_RR21946 [Rhamnella rubrinervis]|uniref:Uncharacterized protein n=1 Tax=Rhamnella rubrinervis TaxID=2594499 RepID=A0A8K0GQL4_9ROSA|nr:hypothetical protein FNV43_RR21946 [Rhamnella rubrinervis]